MVFYAAVEDEGVTKIRFELSAFHAWADVLDWVEDIDPCIKQVGQEGAGRAVGVKEYFFAVAVCEVAPSAQARFEVLLKGRDGNELALLGSEIIGNEEHVDKVTQFGKVALHHRGLDRFDAVQGSREEFLLRYGIHKGVFHAPKMAVYLEVRDPWPDSSKVKAAGTLGGLAGCLVIEAVCIGPEWVGLHFLDFIHFTERRITIFLIGRGPRLHLHCWHAPGIATLAVVGVVAGGLIAGEDPDDLIDAKFLVECQFVLNAGVATQVLEDFRSQPDIYWRSVGGYTVEGVEDAFFWLHF